MASLVEDLGYAWRLHAVTSPQHEAWREFARLQVEQLFAQEDAVAQAFGPFGAITLPYRRMGAIDSLNLFDIEELILFSFYWHNRNRYKCVADVGANIGLHSIVLSKCGFEVEAYEPDPKHVEVLRHNLELNGCHQVKVNVAAVSDKAGSDEFVRVLGNTTGSHLAGAKPSPYGKLERLMVPTVSLPSIMSWADLIKADVEGHEAAMLAATRLQDWTGTDMLVEVGSRENAERIFKHLAGLGIHLFSQKINWGRVSSVEDLPTSYKEGTLFISERDQMPWPVREAIPVNSRSIV